MPVAYSLFDDVAAWSRRRFGTKKVTDKGERELSELLDGASPVEEPQANQT